MSLLTNEQIEELVGITSNQSTSQDLFIEFFDWNEKQTGTQINVNWDDAPKFAGKAVLRLHWVTGGKGSELWTASEDAITLERPEPVITPHPHAEIMMKYAEVAQRRVDPWVEFEWTNGVTGSEVWVLCDKAIGFGYGVRYHHIGDDK